MCEALTELGRTAMHAHKPGTPSTAHVYSWVDAKRGTSHFRLEGRRFRCSDCLSHTNTETPEFRLEGVQMFGWLAGLLLP